MNNLLKIGICTVAPNKDNGYVASVIAIDSYSVYSVYCAPPSYGAVLPEVDTLILYVDALNNRRLISSLGEINMSDPLTTVKSTDHIGEGHIDSMSPGDSFIGKYGRAYFHNTGDVDISSWNERVQISLDNEDGILNMKSNNFSIETQDGAIKSYTKYQLEEGELSDDGNIGNSFYIDLNNNNTGELISRFNISSDGSASFNIASDQLGEAESNFAFNMNMSADGEFYMYNDFAGLDISNVGEVSLYVGSGGYSDAALGINLSSDGTTLDMKSSSTISMDTESVEIGGDVEITGKTTLKDTLSLPSSMLGVGPGPLMNVASTKTINIQVGGTTVQVLCL